jgi:hypothetical protein
MISKVEYPYICEGALQVLEGECDGMARFHVGLELVISGLKQWVAGKLVLRGVQLVGGLL